MKTLSSCLALIVLSCIVALGQTQYKVLWAFGGAPNDGSEPASVLVSDTAGNLFGTTHTGGTSIACYPYLGCGTVFELSPNSDGTWTETVLHSFCGNDFEVCTEGYFPNGLVIDSKGNLYGTNSFGGANPLPDGFGGTIFELSPPSLPGGTWTETTLYSFCKSQVGFVCPDGGDPVGQMAFDSSGNLYGVTNEGGTTSSGTVFEFSPASNGQKEAVLYNFCSRRRGNVCLDGMYPTGGVILDSSGNMYGATRGGGLGSEPGGTIYRLSPQSNGWQETVLHSFSYPAPYGPNPISSDSSGNLYGTLGSGGTENYGGVFRLNSKTDRAGVFLFPGDGLGGSTPNSGVLVDSERAVLYGTTVGGGTTSLGTIFQITASGWESILYNFCSLVNCTDGGPPVGGLIEDKQGNLYGTALNGGSSQNGVVYEITP